MWFFGISTENPRNFWMIGAVVLAIIVTIFVRKWAAHLMTMSEEEEDESLKGDCKIEGENKFKEIVEKKCGHCLPGNYCIRTYGLEELKMATRDFKIKIGVGATSFVYLAELGDGTFGAVKRVMEEKGGSKKVFLNEVSVLLRISHPNLVGLMGFCLDKGEQLLLLEYVPNRSLFDRMHTRHGQSSGILSWSNRVSIALDIARVLEYLHSVADPPVIHRDVKSSNILLIDDNQAKLADFGLCKLGHDSSSVQTPTIIKGSLGYVDINYLNTGVVTPMSDVYSFGVLLLELITGLKSVQGSETLAEWTEEYRKNDQMEVSIGMLDPKLKGDADVGQLRVLIDVANSALLDYCEDRPDMAQIVHRISSCMNPQLQLDLPV